MGQLPAGTITLLFSDIEGSTLLLNRLGAQWAEALSAQRSILRSSFAAHDGHEMGTEGDSFFVVFATAHAALAAALAGQRRLQAHEWPAGVPVRVRMGFHTGEPQRHEDGYIGLDVHRAARIAATAHGGQIVVSEAAKVMLTGLGGDVVVRDLGWHRLKDIEEPEHLFDVVDSGAERMSVFPRCGALERWRTCPCRKPS
ncbi:MAG: adenylate/guanylate cyclase domain-containing protein [Nocardioidaceae bacterium]